MTYYDPYLHSEIPGAPFFTGATPTDRLNHVGYQTVGNSSETITSGSNDPRNPVPAGAYEVRGLLTVPYHAMVLMLVPFTEVGVGISVLGHGEDAVLVPGMGMTTAVGQLPSTSGVRTYPCEGATNVGPTFSPENPSPLVEPRTAIPYLGSNILVAGDHGKVLTLSSAEVLDVAANRALPIYALRTKANDPNAAYYHGTNYGYVLPDETMVGGKTYKVTITGLNGDAPFTKTFSFTAGIGGSDTGEF